MICPNCHMEHLDDYTFCPSCGSKIPSQELQSNVSSVNVSDRDSAASEDPDILPEKEDIFVTPSPLKETMPESYTRPEPSVFVAPTAAASPFAASVYETVPTPVPSASAASSANVSAASVPPSVPPAASAVPAKEVTGRPGAVKPDSTPSQTEATAKKPAEPVIPKEFKPLSTAGIFWYFFLTCIPVIGWIYLLIYALAGKNKNKKSLSRAIFIYWLIFILLLCIAFVAAFVFDRNLLLKLFDQNNWANLANYFAKTFLNL